MEFWLQSFPVHPQTPRATLGCEGWPRARSSGAGGCQRPYPYGAGDPGNGPPAVTIRSHWSSLARLGETFLQTKLLWVSLLLFFFLFSIVIILRVLVSAGGEINRSNGASSRCLKQCQVWDFTHLCLNHLSAPEITFSFVTAFWQAVFQLLWETCFGWLSGIYQS